MKLFIAVLLVVLLEPAAANPITDHVLPSVLMEPFYPYPYPDPEGMLNPICSYCAIPFLQCFHGCSMVSHDTLPHIVASLTSVATSSVCRC